MTYLSIRPDGDWYILSYPKQLITIAVYELPTEAEVLFDKWQAISPNLDDLLSGILADYLEDHKDNFTPIRPIDANWNAMIALLRHRFHKTTPPDKSD